MAISLGIYPIFRQTHMNPLSEFPSSKAKSSQPFISSSAKALGLTSQTEWQLSSFQALQWFNLNISLNISRMETNLGIYKEDMGRLFSRPHTILGVPSTQTHLVSDPANPHGLLMCQEAESRLPLANAVCHLNRTATSWEQTVEI